MKNILLVNPWIYDFAAYDFGIKPVGLLRIGEYLRRHGNTIYLIDCLADCAKQKDEYGFSKIKKQKINKPETISQIKRPYFRYGIAPSEFLNKCESLPIIDEIYVTSGMTYWYPGVFFAIKILRQVFGNTPILLGGIYASLCSHHATRYSDADRVWKGDYLKSGIQTDPSFFPAYDLLDSREILPIQLTFGCPNRCTYCASKILKPRFRMKDPVSLFEEVMHYHRIFGTRHFVFYDDALTYNSKQGIKKFLRMIISSDYDIRFLTPNGLHAKYIDDELAYLLRKSNFRELRLSFETSDEIIQDLTGGKVTTTEIKRSIRNLKEAGFTKNDIGIYLLIGAPWLSIDKSISDVKLIQSLGAKAILASYSPIPGTYDYNILIKNNILKKNTDPLWHNNTIFADLMDPLFTDKIREVRRFTSKLNKQ